jgi:heat shock protein HtpX
MLLAALSALLLLIGQWLGGQNGLTIALVLAVAMNFGSYWFADKIVLRMYNAREVGEDHELYRLTADLAARAGLPMPRVYVIPTPRDILTASIAATVAAAITYLAYAAMWFGGSRDRNVHPIALILMMLLAPIAATILQAAISRSREFAADAAGARIAGRPDGLASALRKIEAAVKRTPLPAGPAAQATEHMFIVKPFSGGGAMRFFSTHPPTEERIARLMEG